MIQFILLFAIVFAEETTNDVEPFCNDEDMFYDRIERRCKEIGSYCSKNDSFWGCYELEEDVDGDGAAKTHFLYEGNVFDCKCGTQTGVCEDGVGCTSCGNEQYNGILPVPAEQRVYQAIANGLPERPYYLCEDLYVDSKNLTAVDRVRNEMKETCAKWGPFGCVECKKDHFLKTVDSYDLCYPFDTESCENFDDVAKNCTDCKDGYYHSGLECVPVDPHCEEYEESDGTCSVCKPAKTVEEVAYYPIGKKCYPCSLGCTKCKEDIKPDRPQRSFVCEECKVGYFMIGDEACVRNPEGCLESKNDKGCIKCDANEGYFLIPSEFKADGNLLSFGLSGKKIGVCSKPLNCTEQDSNGRCLKCAPGYNLQNMSYTADGKDGWLSFCSGASHTFILALIALLMLLAF